MAWVARCAYGDGWVWTTEPSESREAVRLLGEQHRENTGHQIELVELGE